MSAQPFPPFPFFDSFPDDKPFAERTVPMDRIDIPTAQKNHEAAVRKVAAARHKHISLTKQLADAGAELNTATRELQDHQQSLEDVHLEAAAGQQSTAADTEKKVAPVPQVKPPLATPPAPGTQTT